MSAPVFKQMDIARAKINLTLHVGPVQPDGYHPLTSLVVFADIGDQLTMGVTQFAPEIRLSIDGPFGEKLPNDDNNLIIKTAKLFAEMGNGGHPDFQLTKNLPIASGIGGGSADAAAATRLLAQFHGIDLLELSEDLLKLGADIPVCLSSKTCVMRGRGERITFLSERGRLHAVLVNPGIDISTGRVFAEFDNGAGSGEFNDNFLTDGSLLDMAVRGRNDLQAAAISLCPEIRDVLDVIGDQQECQLARMSGSGATCFGLFPSQQAASNAASAIKDTYPHWWCVVTQLGDQE